MRQVANDPDRLTGTVGRLADVAIAGIERSTLAAPAALTLAVVAMLLNEPEGTASRGRPPFELLPGVVAGTR